MRHLHSFLYYVFEIQCIFYTWHIQSRLAIFQELNIHMWLVPLEAKWVMLLLKTTKIL